MTIKFVVIIILNVFFIVIGQTLLKVGMDIEKTLSIKIFINPWIFIGLSIHAITTVVWLNILPKVTFSIAYPLNSVSYIFSMLTSIIILGETITINRVLGTFIILMGIVLIVQ